MSNVHQLDVNRVRPQNIIVEVKPSWSLIFWSIYAVLTGRMIRLFAEDKNEEIS